MKDHHTTSARFEIFKKECVMGLDPSLTSTGVAVIRPPLHEGAESVFTATIKTKAGEDITKRIDYIAGEIIELVLLHRPELVCIEGLAFGARGQSMLDLAGLHHVIRRDLLHYRVEVVAPQALKKFVTGKGNSKKDQMKLAVYKKWGVEFATTDETDAYALAQWGQAFLREYEAAK